MTTHPLDDGLPIYGNSGDITDPDERYAFFEGLIAEKLTIVRNERNRRLSNSDWTQFSDSPLTDEKKTEWQTYRQTLRDITNGFDNDTEINWPSEPS